MKFVKFLNVVNCVGMIHAGYMAKRVEKRPEWLKAKRVADIYSVSGCTSENFTDYIHHWKHNGFWMFDSPEVIRSVAKEDSVDLGPTALFYYEAYEKEFDENVGVNICPTHLFRPTS